MREANSYDYFDRILEKLYICEGFFTNSVLISLRSILIIDGSVMVQADKRSMVFCMVL